VEALYGALDQLSVDLAVAVASPAQDLEDDLGGHRRGRPANL
jgi:hypothetical protein